MVNRWFIPVHWFDKKRYWLPTPLEHERKTTFLTVELKRCEQDSPWALQTSPKWSGSITWTTRSQRHEQVWGGEAHSLSSKAAAVSTTVSNYLCHPSVCVPIHLLSQNERHSCKTIPNNYTLFPRQKHHQPTKAQLRALLMAPAWWRTNVPVAQTSSVTSAPGRNLVLFRFTLCMALDYPWWLSSKESTCHCRRHGFDPWVRKIS